MSTKDTTPALIKYWLLQISPLNGYESAVFEERTLSFTSIKSGKMGGRILACSNN